jgi:hypothetical protein
MFKPDKHEPYQPLGRPVSHSVSRCFIGFFGTSDSPLPLDATPSCGYLWLPQRRPSGATGARAAAGDRPGLRLPRQFRFSGGNRRRYCSQLLRCF